MKKSKRIVARLSRYKNVLYRFRDAGMEKIFSDILADEVGVTSSQVRKDFSLFNLTGNKRAGYSISELIDKLEVIFHKETIQDVVIVGYGRLGSALANYGGFGPQKVRVIAAFDINAEAYSDADVPVYPMESLADYVTENGIEVGILTVPDPVAQECYETMAKAGMKGVLNFAPIPLKPVEGCLVSTYCVEVELENIIYFVNEAKKDTAEDE